MVSAANSIRQVLAQAGVKGEQVQAVGLTIRHSQVHMTRAVLEGVAFGLCESMELIKHAGLSEIQQVRVSGGGARSPLWRQILSDVMNTELVTANTTEGAAFGAALLAGVGAGVWGGAEEACQATIRIEHNTRPNLPALHAYDKSYPLFQGTYPQLKPTFDVIGSTLIREM